MFSNRSPIKVADKARQKKKVIQGPGISEVLSSSVADVISRIDVQLSMTSIGNEAVHGIFDSSLREVQLKYNQLLTLKDDMSRADRELLKSVYKNANTTLNSIIDKRKQAEVVNIQADFEKVARDTNKSYHEIFTNPLLSIDGRWESIKRADEKFVTDTSLLMKNMYRFSADEKEIAMLQRNCWRAIKQREKITEHYTTILKNPKECFKKSFTNLAQPIQGALTGSSYQEQWKAHRVQLTYVFNNLREILGCLRPTDDYADIKFLATDFLDAYIDSYIKFYIIAEIKGREKGAILQELYGLLDQQIKILATIDKVDPGKSLDFNSLISDWHKTLMVAYVGIDELVLPTNNLQIVPLHSPEVVSKKRPPSVTVKLPVDLQADPRDNAALAKAKQTLFDDLTRLLEVKDLSELNALLRHQMIVKYHPDRSTATFGDAVLANMAFQVLMEHYKNMKAYLENDHIDADILQQTEDILAECEKILAAAWKKLTDAMELFANLKVENAGLRQNVSALKAELAGIRAVVVDYITKNPSALPEQFASTLRMKR